MKKYNLVLYSLGVCTISLLLTNGEHGLGYLVALIIFIGML